MRDNGNSDRMNSGSGGAGQIKPADWTRTEFQVTPFEGFKPEEIHRRGSGELASASGPTMRLAEPPKWTHWDDLPCTKLVPKGNGRDPFDTPRAAKAKALCAGCPVVSECLADAMAEEGDLSGRSRWLVRGGLTPHERGRLASVQ